MSNSLNQSYKTLFTPIDLVIPISAPDKVKLAEMIPAFLKARPTSSSGFEVDQNFIYEIESFIIDDSTDINYVNAYGPKIVVILVNLSKYIRIILLAKQKSFAEALSGVTDIEKSIQILDRELYNMDIERLSNDYATIREIARHCLGLEECNKSFDPVPVNMKTVENTQQLRVTPEHIKSVIIDRHIERIPGTTVTVVTLRLRNGACAVGINYGAIDPTQHDWKRGLDEATKKAEEKVYELENYVLRESFRLLELDKNKLRRRATE